MYERVKSVFFCILTCSNNKRFASKSFDLTLLQAFGVSSLVPCPKQVETDILEKTCSGIQITKGQDPKQQSTLFIIQVETDKLEKTCDRQGSEFILREPIIDFTQIPLSRTEQNYSILGMIKNVESISKNLQNLGFSHHVLLSLYKIYENIITNPFYPLFEN